MRLYHFCADRHIKSIMLHGITRGGVTEPTATGYIFHDGYKWLTNDCDPRSQSWATRQRIPYSRTAWRLTIEIPDEFCDRVHDRASLVKLWPSTAALFDGWPGSENWRVYRGMIPKSWIVKAEKMRE